MNQILLSLGTNLGDRRRNLCEAVNRLQASILVTAVSPVYETEAWGVTDQPAFLNICLAAKTDKTPLDLLRFLKQTESDMGRQPSYRWGPRLIDIDILFFADRIIHTPELTIPHPNLAERAFVLAPLADIAFDWTHPATSQTVAEMVTAVDKSGVSRLPEPLFTDRRESP